MNKEELIGKLQMVYVGDKNALNELSGYYDGLKQGIEELQQENQELKAELQLYQGALSREHEAIHRANELEEVIDKATNELFILKDMIYKPETREENFEIQRKISLIIKRLNGKDAQNEKN